MPGMDMSSMNTSATNESPVWCSVVGWIGAVGFAVAAVFWIYRYIRDRRQKTAPRRSLGDLGQAMMAAGMAIFFLASYFGSEPVPKAKSSAVIAVPRPQ